VRQPATPGRTDNTSNHRDLMTSAFYILNHPQRRSFTASQTHSFDFYLQIAAPRHRALRLSQGDDGLGNALLGNHNQIAYTYFRSYRQIYSVSGDYL
jgi:hypothetical protein